MKSFDLILAFGGLFSEKCQDKYFNYYIMKFKEAVELASKNEHLIGKKSDVGIIDQIVIYPTDSVLYEEFKKQFLMNDDHQSIDGNFKDHDVSVGVILNKFMIEENAVFCFSDIFNLEDSLGIIC